MTPEPRSIAAEIAALEKLDHVRLCARYEEIFGRPTRAKNPIQIRRRIVWAIQAERHGGLTDAARARLAELGRAIDLPVQTTTVLPTKTLQPGRVLVREWRNQHIEVRVTDTGFEWNGIPFKSLSAVAKAITGTAWNGPMFFGLTERKRK